MELEMLMVETLESFLKTGCANCIVFLGNTPKHFHFRYSMNPRAIRNRRVITPATIKVGRSHLLGESPSFPPPFPSGVDPAGSVASVNGVVDDPDNDDDGDKLVVSNLA